MFNIGPGELAVILVAALIVLGPKRLPELARTIGKFMREFRRQTDDVRNLVEREFYKMDEELQSLKPSLDPTKPALPTASAAAPKPHVVPPISHTPDPGHDEFGRLLPVAAAPVVAPVVAPAPAAPAAEAASAEPVADPKTGTR